MGSSRVFHHARSGNSLRAAIGVEISGLDIERVAVDLAANEHRSIGFLRANAAGTVPVYVEFAADDEAAAPWVLTQSAAILEHLARDARPDWFPQDARENARMRASVLAAAGDLAVQNALMRYLAFSPESVRFIRERWLRMLRASFEALDTQPYVCGARPTLADFAHVPIVHMRRPMLSSSGGFDAVLRWADRLCALEPAVERAAAYAGLVVPDDRLDD